MAPSELSGSSPPMIEPMPAPTDSEGEKMPPGMPQMPDRTVASSFGGA